MTIHMPGLKFPTNKEKLLEYAKIRNDRTSLFFIKNIQENKAYADVFQLQEDFRNILNNTPNLKESFKKMGSRGFVECIIDTSEPQPQQLQQPINAPTVRKEAREAIRKLTKQRTPEGIMSPLGEGEGEIRLTLPGLKFPTNKEKLMQIAKKHDDKLDPRDLEMSSMLHIVEKLPDSIKTYSEAQLEEEVIKICNTDKKLIEDARWFDIQKVVGCIINKEGEILYPFYLPGFTFPTTKEKIIQYFEKLQREGGRKYNIELAMTRHLPDDKREYNKSELEGELSRVARYKEKTTLIRVSGETMKIVGIVITEHNTWKEKLRSTTQLTKV